jgi:hypothetical protein
MHKNLLVGLPRFCFGKSKSLDPLFFAQQRKPGTWCTSWTKAGGRFLRRQKNSMRSVVVLDSENVSPCPGGAIDAGFNEENDDDASSVSAMTIRT